MNMVSNTRSVSTQLQSPISTAISSDDDDHHPPFDDNTDSSSLSSSGSQLSSPSFPELRIVYYPLPKMGHSNLAGRLHVYGNPSSKHLIMMSAGFPDSHNAMKPMAQRLASNNNNNHNCLVAITCPPGYDDSMEWNDYPSDGFTFEDWVVNMREAVKALRTYSTQPVSQTTLTGIFHDWGVMMGTMYMNSTAIDTATEAETTTTRTTTVDSSLLGLTMDRLVIYDVLIPPHPHTQQNRPKGFQNNTLWGNFCLITYQLVLAGTFWMHRFVPFPYVTLLYDIVTNAILSFCGMYPISQEDRLYLQQHWKKSSLQDRQKSWYMAYPYFQLWKQVFQGKIHDLVVQLALPQDLSKIPVLYLYGSSKPYDLADPNALELLKWEQAKGGPSRVVQVDSAGHWLYVQQPDLCYNAMKQFFEDTMKETTTALEDIVPSQSASIRNNNSCHGSTDIISCQSGSDNIQSREITTKPNSNSRSSGRIALDLPNSQSLLSNNGNSDSISTAKTTTSVCHEMTHNGELSMIELWCNRSNQTGNNCCPVVLNNNSTKCNRDNGSNSSSSNNNNNNNRPSSYTSSQVQPTKGQTFVNMADLVEGSICNTPLQENELWKSKAALRLYAVVFLSISLRRFFVLQGISLVILFHIIKLLFAWFLYVMDAKEIREFSGLAIWWINFGLRFSTKTIEGDTLHRILTAFTLNFWKGTGINLLKSIYQSIDRDGREKLLRHARENLNRTQITHMKWKNMLQNQQRSK